MTIIRARQEVIIRAIIILIKHLYSKKYMKFLYKTLFL